MNARAAALDLSVQGIAVSFGGIHALRGVSLTAPAG
jgi:ABC-type uncharacterized transport system ATPase subunit